MAEWKFNTSNPSFGNYLDDTLEHHGILGMKWGVRRYQNKDGSLTPAGMKRYYYHPDKEGYAGNLLTEKGKKEFKNKDGSWKNTPAALKAKEREEANIKKAHEINGEENSKYFGVSKDVGTRLSKEYNAEVKNFNGDEYTLFTKMSPKGKKREYEIHIDSDDLNKNYHLKSHDIFEKNSDAILKECENVAYDGIEDWLKTMGSSATREDVIGNFDTPSVRIIPEWNMAEITYFSPDIMHFPSVEYDLKNRKARMGSVDG